MNEFEVMVVGCGEIAGIWVDYAVESGNAEVVALVDLDRGRSERMADEHGVDADIFEDVDRALNERDVDLVFNLTSPEAHQDIGLKCLAEGCHVFSEKPLAESIEGAREIVDASRRHRRTYAVMQNRRYTEGIRKLKDLVSSGRIGSPGYVTADFYLGPHWGSGFRESMEDPLLLDMAVHTFDQARFITDADPRAVYCHEFNPLGSWYDGDAAADCVFEMSDGSVFSYRGSWCAEGAPTSWESRWRVMGSEGTALWDGKGDPCAEVVESDEDEFLNEFERIESNLSWNGKEGHEGCLDDMFAHLKRGTRPPTDCTDNIRSFAMVLGAIESARKDERVELEF